MRVKNPFLRGWGSHDRLVLKTGDSDGYSGLHLNEGEYVRKKEISDTANWANAWLLILCLYDPHYNQNIHLSVCCESDILLSNSLLNYISKNSHLILPLSSLDKWATEAQKC